MEKRRLREEKGGGKEGRVGSQEGSRMEDMGMNSHKVRS